MRSAVGPVLWPEISARPDPSVVLRPAHQLGAYYTPSVTASFMADWAIRAGDERVLEPSMGDGQFLRAVTSHAARRDFNGVQVWGVELDSDTYRLTVGGGVVEPERAILGNFLDVVPFPVNVVIGNPPYVRLRHLPQDEADHARATASQALGMRMDPAGSVWLPFVTHTTNFIELGGRLAFVLPYDFTYVRYAKPLWRFLGREYGSLRVVRVRERLFPDILQEVVLLLADDRGGRSNAVQFDCYEKPLDLLDAEPSRSTRVALDRIVTDDRPFTEALLPDVLRELLHTRLARLTQPVSDYVTWNIGYVTGDKRFFHPSEEDVEEFNLPASSLVPSLASGRRAAKKGLRTSGFPQSSIARLFLPSESEGDLTEGERAYIQVGVSRGVERRYKCRIREPWYVTPGVKIPDLLMPVFADRPALFVNDGGFAASNSMLAGYLHGGSQGHAIAAWYTSLTLLQIELNVHSLGGGVMVLVPREVGAIRTPILSSTEHLEAVGRHLGAGDTVAAYRSGDAPVLGGSLGLTPSQVELIHGGVEILRRWRMPNARRVDQSQEEVVLCEDA